MVRLRTRASNQTTHLLNDERQLTVNGFDRGLVPGSGLARDYPPALRFLWDRVLPGIARVLTLVVSRITAISACVERVNDDRFHI